MYEIDRAKLVWRKLDNELVVLNLEEGSYFTMNAVGSTIWEALCDGQNAEHAANCVVRDFKIDVETARLHTTEYIRLLLEQDLLKPVVETQ